MIDLATIVKTDNIITVTPDVSLAQALAHLSTSHDAAFVFDEKQKYLGVVNPYYALIRSSHPGNAKIVNCLHHPPKIYIDYPLPKVATLLIESKIHYLPVFDRKDNFLGIISARRLLSKLSHLEVFKKPIAEAIRFKRRPLTVVYEDETVAQAINLFKSTKLSKLVVINRDMKLKGILSYYDLIAFMLDGKKPGGGRKEIVGNKVHLFNQRVRNYMKTYVLSLKKDNFVADAFKLILDKKIGSVVVVDGDRHPTGIVTTRDLLRLFIDSQRTSIFSKLFLNKVR